MGQATQTTTRAPAHSDDAIDELLDEVGEAVERLDCREALELRPTAAEAVLALLGCTSGLRPGSWAALARHLRQAMASDRGIAVGAC